MTATLPAALGGHLVERGRLDWKRDVVPLLPWFVIGFAAGLFTAWVERRYIGAEGALSPERWSVVCWRGGWSGSISENSFGRIIYFIYPRWQVSPAMAWQYLFPLGVVALLAIYGARAADPGGFGGISIFRRFARSGPGFCQRLSFRLFLCSGSLPIPGQLRDNVFGRGRMGLVAGEGRG